MTSISNAGSVTLGERGALHNERLLLSNGRLAMRKTGRVLMSDGGRRLNARLCVSARHVETASAAHLS
jgi:hypothetical protein